MRQQSSRFRGSRVSRALRFAIAAIVIDVSRAGAQFVAPSSSAPVAASREPDAVVEAAPGGGDMVMLGPASRYVTRAWREGTGRVQSKCAREHAESPERRINEEWR